MYGHYKCEVRGGKMKSAVEPLNREIVTSLFQFTVHESRITEVKKPCLHSHRDIAKRARAAVTFGLQSTAQC
jgi:hypothetical protein